MPITTAYLDRYAEVLTRAGLSKADRCNRIAALLRDINPACADSAKGLAETLFRMYKNK